MIILRLRKVYNKNIGHVVVKAVDFYARQKDNANNGIESIDHAV